MSLYPNQPVLKMLLELFRPLYILEGREVVSADTLEWNTWMAQNDCTVEKTDFENFNVVTTFLGRAVRPEHEEAPRTFLTSILEPDGSTWPIGVYATWDEAERGHQEIVGQIADWSGK